MTLALYIAGGGIAFVAFVGWCLARYELAMDHDDDVARCCQRHGRLRAPEGGSQGDAKAA